MPWKKLNEAFHALDSAPAEIDDAAFEAIENAVEEAIEAGRNVYVVGARGTTRQRLDQFKLYEQLPADHTELNRHQALTHAVQALA